MNPRPIGLPLTRRDAAVAAGLAALVAIFWLPFLGAARHGYDQAYQTWLALRILDLGERPLVGQPSSIFLDNPPLMAYLQAVPLAVWRAPWVPYAFVAALNAIGGWLIFLTGRRLFSFRAGTLAAGLYLVNPWVVHYGRMPWTQGLMPFWLALLAWSAWPILVERRGDRGRLLVMTGAAIGLTQSYVLGMAILAPLGLLFAVLRPRLPRAWGLAALVAIVLAFAPYTIGLLDRPATNSDKAETLLSALRPGFSPAPLSHALRFVTGQDYNGQDEFEPAELAPAPIMWLSQVGLSLAVAGGAWRLVRRRERASAWVLGAWLGVPVGGFMLLPTLVHPHYMLLTVPAAHLLAAVGLDGALERAMPWRRRAAAGLIVAALLAIALQFHLNLQANAAAVRTRPVAYGFNGWALEEASRLAARLRPVTTAGELPLRLYAADHPALLSSMAGVPVTTLREPGYPTYLVLAPGTDLPYVLLDQPFDPALAPWLTPVPSADLTLADGHRVQVALARPAEAVSVGAAGDAVETVDYPSDAGLRLLGYAAEWGAAELRLTVTWRVDSVAAAGEPVLVGAYYKLFGPDGLLAEANPHAQWNYLWADGDVIVERVTLAVAADSTGPLDLEISLFDPIQFRTFLFEAPDERLLAVRRPLAPR